VFGSGTRASDRYFTFIALPNHLEKARLGVAVSKKALRLAAERNRVRRLIRETYRLSVARDFPLDLVVMVKHTARDVPSAVLAAALNQRWLTIPGFHHRLTRDLNEASP
jgi:ribonuclease P protein component